MGARIEKLPDGAAVVVTQSYSDETFQKQNQGIDTGSMPPLEPRSDKEVRDGRASGLYWYLGSPHE